MAESDSQPDERALGAEARGLMRRAVKASFATVGAAADPATAGWPAAALVTVACACDGSPILLLSTLAHHTRNILADPRAALLFDATEGFANPQAGPRVTAMGRVTATKDKALARRFLARHPAARAYAGFGDFAFYKMAVERLHFVGGFARARWVGKRAAILPSKMCAELARHEDEVLAHMNRDHAETLRLYARRLLGARTAKVELVAVDPEGFDLRCGRTLKRLDFASPVTTLSDVRAAFVRAAEAARASATG
jgi:putative heme iron utilization protein